MNKEDIDKIIKSISTVKTTRDYWFVRTQGGSYYNDFLSNGYIAIGYEEISFSDISAANKSETGKNILTEIIKKKFPAEARPGFISHQLIDFAYNISKGDIVIIPSNLSEYISIGEVVETPIYQAKKQLLDEECPFLKRKKIKWLRINVPLDSLDSKLITLKYSQKTITKVNDELTTFFDRIITPLFIKENDAHLSLDIRKKEKINAYELFQTWTELLDLTEEFGKENEIEIDKKSFDIKINVQSPGTIEFITYGIAGIVVLSVLIVAIIGAEYESNTRPIRFKIKSDGLLKKMSEFLDAKQNRLIKSELIAKVKAMEINPDEVAKILEQVNNDSSKN
jgi:predicted Mrr-cat superfamily restriction endonuclease